MTPNPKITIITVVRNGALVIEETIRSVLSQTYPNIEYIIIDGQSSDDTLSIIRQYEGRITRWVSEADRGIYFAMNKGIGMATGDWINFMNAGDTFFKKDSIAEIISHLEPDADVVFGDTQLVLKFGDYIKKGDINFSRSNTMPFVHQSSLTRSSVLKAALFDTTYKICADRAFFYMAYQQGRKFQYIPLTFSRFEAEDGLSSSRLTVLELEMAKIAGFDRSLFWRIKHLYRIAVRKIKGVPKELLPAGIVTIIRKRNAERNYSR